MAKLTITDPKTPIKYSAIPQTSTLALPLSLATQKGAAITSFVKAVAAIQQDLHQIEDENQLNEVLPGIVTGIQTAYETWSKTTDLTNGPKKFEENLDIKNYAKLLKGKNKNVTRLLEQELNKQKIKLLPNLVTAITSNVVETNLMNINTNFNEAMKKIISGDAALIGLGTIDFNSIINNKNYAALIGPVKWKEWTDKKQLELDELLIDIPLKINPEIFIENKKALVKAVGVEKSIPILEKAAINLISKTTEDKKKEVLLEIADNETKMHAFAEILLRINKGKIDKQFADEVPTVADLHDAYEYGMINKVMYNMSIKAIQGKEELTDPEMYELLTVAIYSADGVERMDDIKRAFLLDPQILKKVGLKDITLFTAIIDKAKKDFTAHQDYKTYSKLIDENLKNLTNITSGKMLKFAQNLGTKKVLIQQAYTQKVLDGMAPKHAYMSVLENEMDVKSIPSIKNAAPGFLRNINLVDSLKKEPDKFWIDIHQLAYDRFNGVVQDGKQLKGHGDMNKFKQELSQLDFMQDLFDVRMSVSNDDIEWSSKGGSVSDLIDKLFPNG